MFKPTSRPRVFGIGLGHDYAVELVEGIKDRLAQAQPVDMAHVEIFVNTHRLQTRLTSIFIQSGSGFLPKIRLITDLGNDPLSANIPKSVSPLQRRLELRQLVLALLEKEPDFAPKHAAFDLADSLAGLLDEMQSEGVSPKDIGEIDIGKMSQHWERSYAFINLIDRYFNLDETDELDKEARQRKCIEATIKHWDQTPPQHPVLIAGSTGSRGATSVLMQAISKLPQGAVILPGFDFEQSGENWSHLTDSMSSEDHPQFRFSKLAAQLDIAPRDVDSWTEHAPFSAARNELISLALCPAPVTDQWMSKGKDFPNISDATDKLTLIEARTPRDEARAIALILKKSLHEGLTAAVITPDRNLTRQIFSILNRWGLTPDDSAGQPLALSAPGRFLRQTLDLMCDDIDNQQLLALLKHPLTNSTEGARGDHLRWTREFELQFLRGNISKLNKDGLLAWAEQFPDDPGRLVWMTWVADTFLGNLRSGSFDFEELIDAHIDLSVRIAAGGQGEAESELWKNVAGEEALRVVEDLQDVASFGGSMSPSEFRDLFRSVLGQSEVRNPTTPNESIKIWGTMEARVQGADRVICAGLNDGTWPATPAPDPWLNRQMRLDAGLLLPERRIGLSAHDFQQAVTCKEVILTRSTRSETSETVPSRWVNRLTNLLEGMSQDGKTSLEEMRARGSEWLQLSGQLDTPAKTTSPSPRPSPAPPVSVRPNQLSATAITKLVRDPYAIYASRVLKLRPLNSLAQDDTPLTRGMVLHSVFERFIEERPKNTDLEKEHQRLVEVSEKVLSELAPSVTVKRLWQARVDRIADWFLSEEEIRRKLAHSIALEIRGSTEFHDIGFTLSAQADRIDVVSDDEVVIFDYKTGSPPTAKEQKHFDKQLLLEAVIVEAGGFQQFGATKVREATYLGLGKGVSQTKEFSRPEIDQGRADLVALISAYQSSSQGFTSRRAVQLQRFEGDYDHLARFGEWDDSDSPVTIEVGK